MIFNTFITNGVFMSTRTLLHMKWVGLGGVFFFFDKITNTNKTKLVVNFGEWKKSTLAWVS